MSIYFLFVSLLSHQKLEATAIVSLEKQVKDLLQVN